MKKIATSLISIMVLLFTSISQAATIAINPIDQTVLPGFVIGADVVIQGLGDSSAPSLAIFDLDISYDPTIITFNGAVIGDPILGDQLDLSGFGSISSVDGSTLGVVNLFGLSLDIPTVLDSTQASNFVLANLTFFALAPGSSQLEISLNAVGDALGNPLAINVQRGKITVVPIPGTVWLMIGPVLMLGWFVFRRDNASFGRAYMDPSRLQDPVC